MMGVRLQQMKKLGNIVIFFSMLLAITGILLLIEWWGTRIHVTNNSSAPADVQLQCPNHSARAFGIIEPGKSESRFFWGTGEGGLSIRINGAESQLDSYVTSMNNDIQIEILPNGDAVLIGRASLTPN
jgi:hypothetical protein